MVRPSRSLIGGYGLEGFIGPRSDLALLRIELAIITFGPAAITQNFVTALQFVPPTLEASKDTPLGTAINLTLDKLDERKQVYKHNGISYYRPWFFLITDGAPTDGSLWQAAAQRVHEVEHRKKIAFFPRRSRENKHERFRTNFQPPIKNPRKSLGSTSKYKNSRETFYKHYIKSAGTLTYKNNLTTGYHYSLSPALSTKNLSLGVFPSPGIDFFARQGFTSKAESAKASLGDASQGRIDETYPLNAHHYDISDLTRLSDYTLNTKIDTKKWLRKKGTIPSGVMADIDFDYLPDRPMSPDPHALAH